MPAFHWTASRASALTRLAAFAPDTGAHYARSRNFDHGPDDRSNVSLLSPWVRHRLITEREILERTLNAHDLHAAEKFVQEVFWRGYFKGWLEHYPGVWRAYEAERDAALARLETAPALKSAYERALAGETGIDVFDHFSRELVETGYLHNHARMWFASIWIFTLKLPWTLGADFFLRMLIDGDPASNTLSWRWVGGLHTRGKTYLARRDNIRKYTNDRFDAGGLAGHAEPLTEDLLIEKQALFHRAGSVPTDKKLILLATEDDGCLETLAAPLKPVAVGAIAAPDRRSPLRVSDQVHAFTGNALADALTRAEAAFNAPARQFDGSAIDDFVTWSQSQGAQAVIAPHAPAGPTRDLADAVRQKLAAHAIDYREVTRDYDRAVWPHADKGFFKLKKKIPTILNALGLGETQGSLL